MTSPTTTLVPLDAGTLVGRLALNHQYSVTHPLELCLDDGQLYRNGPARIGDVNLFVGPAVELVPLASMLVAARGQHGASLLDALTALGPCPPGYGDHAPVVQMRSDWVAAEGGFRTTRERVAALPYLRAVAVEPVELHHQRSRRDDDPVVVDLINPFDHALDGLTARAHYEGGPGKPMPMFQPLTLNLPAGATQTVRLTGSIEGGPAGSLTGSPRGRYNLHSIDLSGEVAGARFDVALILDVPRVRRLRKPGAP